MFAFWLLTLERFFYRGQKGGDLENVMFSVYSRKVASAAVKSVISLLRVGQNHVPEFDGNNFELIGKIFPSEKSI